MSRAVVLTAGAAFACGLAAPPGTAHGQPPAAPVTPPATPPIVAAPVTPTPASAPDPAPAAAPSACAAGAKSPTDKPSAKATVEVPTINAAVPDAPAFAFLGVTPTQITQPQTARELGAAAASAIGSDGKLHQGVSIEWTPAKTLFTPTLADYDRWYIVQNAQLSFATSQGVGAGVDAAGAEATATDAALGVRLTLWNPDDPVRVLRQRYWDEVSAARELAVAYHAVQGPPETVGEAVGFCTILDHARAGKAADGSAHPELVAAAAKVDAQHKALAAAEANLKKKWNQTALAVGGAIGELFPDSRWKSHTFRGWAGWGTLAYGIGSMTQVVVTGRYHSAARTDTPGDTSLVGGRVIVGNASFTGFGELAWNWLTPENELTLPKDSWGQATLGFEIKLGDKTWLVASFGGTFEKSDQQNDFFAASNFKWSFGDKTMAIGPIR